MELDSGVHRQNIEYLEKHENPEEQDMTNQGKIGYPDNMLDLEINISAGISK